MVLGCEEEIEANSVVKFATHLNLKEEEVLRMVFNKIYKYVSTIIVSSNSPYNSPLWVVPKKADTNGKSQWGVVIDYRKLNEQTIDNMIFKDNCFFRFSKY